MDTTYKVIDNSYYIFMSETPTLSDIKPVITGGNPKYVEFSIESASPLSPLNDFTKNDVIDNLGDKITGGFNLDANLSESDSSSLASEQINRILNTQSGGDAANFNTDLFKQLMMQGSENSDSLTESLSNQPYGSNAHRINKIRHLEEDDEGEEDDDSDSADDDEEYDDDDDDNDEDDEEDEDISSASSKRSSSMSPKKFKRMARNLAKGHKLKNAHRPKGAKDLTLLNNLTFRAHMARSKHGPVENSDSSVSPLAYKGNEKNSERIAGGSSEDNGSASYLESSINTNSINLIKGTRTIN